MFAYLQCTISVMRLLTDGGTPLEAKTREHSECKCERGFIWRALVCSQKNEIFKFNQIIPMHRKLPI